MQRRLNHYGKNFIILRGTPYVNEAYVLTVLWGAKLAMSTSDRIALCALIVTMLGLLFEVVRHLAG